MKYVLLISATLLVVMGLARCNNAKSPDAVATDTAAADQKAATKVADAQNKASKDNAKMQATVDDKAADLSNTEAKGAYDVAMKQADGAHDIALQQCQALAGDSQKNARIKRMPITVSRKRTPQRHRSRKRISMICGLMG